MKSRVDRNANNPVRVRRALQQIADGGATGTIGVTAPITNSGTAIGLSLLAAGGLRVSSSALALLLDPTNPGLALSAAGLKVLLSGTSLQSAAGGLSISLRTNPGLQIATGLGVLLDATPGLQLAVGGLSVLLAANSGLQLAAGGLSAKVDGTTIVNTAGTLGAPAGSLLTTKGDLFTFAAANARLAVGSDGQVLQADSSQTTGLRWASPTGRKNAVHNANCNLWQRGTTFAALATAKYHADRWAHFQGGTQVHTVAQAVDAPDTQSALSMKCTVTTANAAPTAAQFSIPFQQAHEGWELASIFGRAVTFSFWVKSSVTGTFPAAFRNGAGTRSYVALYTVNAANTWEKKTITLTWDTTAASWVFASSAISFTISFTVMAGTNFNTTAGAWQAGNFFSTAACANLDATLNATFQVTRVQLEVGSVATEFEHLGAPEEFEIAHRYYNKSFPYATAPAQNVGSAAGAVRFINSLAGANRFQGTWVSYPVEMRAAPTITFFNPNAANANWRNTTLAADSAAAQAEGASDSNKGAFLNNPGVAGDATPNRFDVHYTAEAEL